MGKHKVVPKLVCMHCGSPEVEVQVWMNISDFKISGTEDFEEGTEGYCVECGQDTKLTTFEEYNFRKEDVDSHTNKKDE